MSSEIKVNWVKLKKIVDNDIDILQEKEKSYGHSWRKRGGVGAFFNTERKWDRIVHQCESCDLDMFQANKEYAEGDESFLEGVRDLRRYLLLVEEYLLNIAQVD